MLGREHDIAVNPEACPVQAKRGLLQALDLHALWRACVDLVNQHLPCHSCTLMYDINSSYQPQRSLHFLGASAGVSARPLRSLEVAAPYLQRNPRIDWYTLSQIASTDAQARMRLRAQNPAPGWNEFIHMAFWREKGLDAVLSIRMQAGQEQITDAHQRFLDELHQLMAAGLQRVRSMRRERRSIYQALLDRQSQADIVLDHELHLISLSPAAQLLCAGWLEEAGTHVRFPDTVASALRGWLRLANQAGDADSPREALDLPAAQLRISLQARLQADGLYPMYLLRLTPLQSVAAEPPMVTRPMWSRLSPTETRVAELVLDGMRNDEIANHLRRSRKTIESQISAIYRKLDVGHRAQLVRLLSVTG